MKRCNYLPFISNACQCECQYLFPFWVVQLTQSVLERAWPWFACRLGDEKMYV